LSKHYSIYLNTFRFNYKKLQEQLNKNGTDSRITRYRLKSAIVIFNFVINKLYIF